MRERYAQLGLPPADVIILADEVSVSRYFDAALAEGATAKQAANWVMGDLMAYCKVPACQGIIVHVKRAEETLFETSGLKDPAMTLHCHAALRCTFCDV